MQIKEKIEHYNRKVSMLNEFKKDVEKHVPKERAAEISRKLEQKRSYYLEQKFNLLANKHDADRSNNLAIMLIVLIAIGALGYFSSLQHSNQGYGFTGFSVSDPGNESNNESYGNESLLIQNPQN